MEVVSSEAISEKFPWWEPWDDTPSKPSSLSGKRGCPCKSSVANPSLQQAYPAAEEALQSVPDVSADMAAGEEYVADGRVRYDSARCRVDADTNSTQLKRARFTVSTGLHKRPCVDDHVLNVDSAKDQSWLDGLANDALTDEVHRRQAYLMEALARRQQIAAHVEGGSHSEGSNTGTMLSIQVSYGQDTLVCILICWKIRFDRPHMCHSVGVGQDSVVATSFVYRLWC